MFSFIQIIDNENDETPSAIHATYIDVRGRLDYLDVIQFFDELLSCFDERAHVDTSESASSDGKSRHNVSCHFSSNVCCHVELFVYSFNETLR